MKCLVIFLIILLISFNAFASVNKDIATLVTQNDFSTLNDNITCSLYILKLSNSISDKSMQNAIGLAYNESLKDIESESGILSDKIIKELINNKESMFLNFISSFDSAPSGVKSGYSVLAERLIGRIHQSELTHPLLGKYRKKTSEILESSIAAVPELQGVFSGIYDLIQKYGMYVNKVHKNALDDLLHTNNREKYIKKRKYVQKAFSLYITLNHKLCTKPKDRVDSAQDVYNQAENAKNSGRYNEAITLFRKVISLDSQYAYENGCYSQIGGCYQYLADYMNAVKNYELSIIHDINTYKGSSYYNANSIFKYYLPKSEQTLKDGDEFYVWVIKNTTYDYLKQNAYWDHGEFLFYTIAQCVMDDATKEKYFNIAISAYSEAEINCKPDVYFDFRAGSVMRMGQIYDSMMAGFTSYSIEKRLAFHDKAISEYLRILKDYPDSVSAPYAYYYAAESYRNCYLKGVYNTEVEKRELLKQAANKYYSQVEKFPDAERSETSLYRYIDICGNSLGKYSNERGHTVYQRDYLEKSNTACGIYLKKYPKGYFVLRRPSTTCRRFRRRLPSSAKSTSWTRWPRRSACSARSANCRRPTRCSAIAVSVSASRIPKSTRCSCRRYSRPRRTARRKVSTRSQRSWCRRSSPRKSLGT